MTYKHKKNNRYIIKISSDRGIVGVKFFNFQLIPYLNHLYNIFLIFFLKFSLFFLLVYEFDFIFWSGVSS